MTRTQRDGSLKGGQFRPFFSEMCPFLTFLKKNPHIITPFFGVKIDIGGFLVVFSCFLWGTRKGGPGTKTEQKT
jgi:hypothetical protein